LNQSELKSFDKELENIACRRKWWLKNEKRGFGGLF
jgi:hypothetical protein